MATTASKVAGNSMATTALNSAAPASKKSKQRLITPNAKDSKTSLDRRMTVDKDIVDELLLVCGVIGTASNEGDELVPVTDCLNWLQDLQRALRRDEDLYRPISLLIGKWKVVEQKLLPLVMTCRYDTPLVLTVVKILVILTKPLSENTQRAGRMVIDTKSPKSNPVVVKQQIQLRDNAVEQAELLMEYKRAVVASHSKGNSSKSNGLLSIFVSLLAEPLSKTGAARTDTDHLTIELVLHLFRNLLAAEPLLNTSSETSRQSNQLHQELITLFEKELVLEIFLVLGQEMDLRENAQYNLLTMELLHHLLKSHDPSTVARSNAPQKTANALPKRSSLLANKRKQEQSQARVLAGVRHGHFGGTWLTQKKDGKRQYVGAAKSNQPTQRLTQAKRKNRKAEPFVGSSGQWIHSVRVPTEEGPVTRRANQSLHKFCQRFLKDCYGPVMKSLKNEFRRDSFRLEEEDKVVFFRLVWFFSQWWRLSRTNKELGNLIFTMDVFTFNLVLNAADHFHQHKKYPRLAQAVALYSEMTYLLHDMYSSADPTESVMALGLMDRLFYGNEPLDRLPKLLSRWTPGTTTREYLCDLVELCHVTFKLLNANEKSCHEEDQSKDTKQHRNNVQKMKAIAAEFDVKSYFCRKIVSNQLVSMYIHLLGQYKINSPQINHHVLAMFLRLSRTEIAAPEAHSADTPINPLGIRRVTLEPMLYSIQLTLVMEKILNDVTVRNDKDFESLIAFCNSLLYKFWEAAQTNPMLYVECLFKHVAPHRFCESVTNMYVSEELRMLAERELLLEEQRRYEAEAMDGVEEGNGVEDEDAIDDDEEELEFTGDAVQPGEAGKVKKTLKKVKKSMRNKPSIGESTLQRTENETATDKEDAEFDSDSDTGGASSASVTSVERETDGEDSKTRLDKETVIVSKRDRDASEEVASEESEKQVRPTKKRIVEDESSDEEINFADTGPKQSFVFDDDEED